MTTQNVLAGAAKVFQSPQSDSHENALVTVSEKEKVGKWQVDNMVVYQCTGIFMWF